MSEAKMAVPFVASSPDPEVPEKAQRRKFSAEDKKRILEEVDRAAGHGGIGAVLRREGLGARTTAPDLLVFGRRGPIGNRLRHANEPARHKILDILGDLALLGCDLVGHIVAYRSGHPHNIQLAHLLSLQMQTVLPRQRLAA